MSLERYWHIFRKWWQLVLACFLVAGAGALFISLMLAPTYQSTALIQVVIHSGGDQSNINELLASNQLVQTEASLATSDPVLRAVARQDPPLSVMELSKMVSASPRLNTQLFAIDVLDTDSVRAARIANDVAATLIAQQEKTRSAENKTDQQQLQQEIDATQQQIDTMKSQLSDVTIGTTEKEELQGHLTTLQQHNTQWQSALAQLELLEAQSGNFLQIMQEAQPAPQPIQPNVRVNTLIGLLTGLMIGCLLALFFERSDQHIRTAEVLGQMVSWPVLSTVGYLNGQRNSSMYGGNANRNSEAYRILRSNIGFAEVDKPLRLLMITSALAKEGKSTVAANLAMVMAKAGKSTLLIDADLRHPTLHERFNLPSDKQGLSNAILTCSNSSPVFTPVQFQSLLTPVKNSSSVSLHRFIHTVGIPNLGVMPSGPLPPNPSELLSSNAMQRFFACLKNCGAEVIIFDTVPLLNLADAYELASKMDGTIVVVDAMRSRKPAILQLKTTLATAGANVVGCVMYQRSRKYKKIEGIPSAPDMIEQKRTRENQDHSRTTDGISPAIQSLFNNIDV